MTDIELRVIGGALLKPEQGGKQLPLGDGVDINDKPFRTTFPYVALPDSGFDAKFGRDRAGPRPGPAAAGLMIQRALAVVALAFALRASPSSSLAERRRAPRAPRAPWRARC